MKQSATNATKTKRTATTATKVTKRKQSTKAVTYNMSEPTIDTLDDAAALLVQLDSTDLNGLAQVQEALGAISIQASTPAGAKILLATAIELLKSNVSEEASEPDAMMAEVGRLIERALCVDGMCGT